MFTSMIMLCVCFCTIYIASGRNSEKGLIKAMDQGRPLEGARAHYDFLLTTGK